MRPKLYPNDHRIQKLFTAKYFKMCWKKFLDEKKPYEKRLNYLEDFERVYFLREKAKIS